MATKLKLGTDNNWATKVDKLLAYNDENGNFKPIEFDADRGSTSTRVNKSGLVENVEANRPRVQFDNNDGYLLLEPSRTNLQVRSEEFDNAAWTKSNCTVSANQTTSPDGATTADKIIENSGSGSKKVYDGITTSSGTVYTWSVFLKADTRSKARLNIFGSYAEFDVANQTLLTQSGITSYKIEDYGNGWGRFSITETANATSTLTYVYLLDDAGNVSYTGDGVSGLFVWGAQLEAGTYPTGYIKNVDTSSGVTRTKDTVKLENFSDMPTDYPFTAFVDMDIIEDEKGYGFSIIDISTTDKYWSVGYSEDSGTLGKFRFSNRAQGASYNFNTTLTYGTGRYKIAIKFISATNFKAFIDGVEVADYTHTSSAFNTNINDVLLGQLRVAGDVNTRNTVYQFMLFNEELSDSELETITSYTSFNKMAKALLYTIE